MTSILSEPCLDPVPPFPAVGDGEVSLTWTPPSMIGDGATPSADSYTVLSYANGSASPAITQAGLTSTAATVTGLADGSSYRFAVEFSIQPARVRFLRCRLPSSHNRLAQAAVDQAAVDQAAVDQAAADQAAVEPGAVDQAAVEPGAVDQAAVDQATLILIAVALRAADRPAPRRPLRRNY